VNTERLRELAEHLRSVSPEKFDMGRWCGTACCIAGHTIRLAGERPNERRDLGGFTNRRDAQGYFLTYQSAAMEWLDIPWGVSEELMVPKHAIAYHALPQEAAVVVDHLAENGWVNWDIIIPTIQERVAREAGAEKTSG
jgi:hypothetical protein